MLIVDARRSPVLRDGRWLLLALVAMLVVAIAYRLVPLTNWSTDSLYYLEFARLLSDDQLGDGFLGELEKRQLAVPAVHALAIQAGQGDVFRILGPLLAVSLVALVWWFVSVRLRDALGVRAHVVGLAAGFAVITFNRVVFHIFYVNSHLMFATLLLAVVCLLWARTAGFDAGASPRATIAVPAILAPTLIVARPEGALVALIVAVALVSVDRRRCSSFFPLAVAVSIIVWNSRLAWGALDDGITPSSSSVLMLALGVTVGAIVGFLHLLPRRLVAMAPWLLEAILWVALLVLAVREPEVLLRSVAATGANLVAGEGGWGLSGPFMLAIVAGALLVFRRSDDLVLRITITSFVPLSLLLAYFRDSAYRVGDGDSLNRMWMHVLALCIVLVVERVALGELRWTARRSESASTSAANGAR
ncbi:hypothetical protein [Chryseoglobus sp. 28M-23]|uniref:hypothetical protein n=1 Tax=Chryseoglobus sp. 28M-23 TaxID=2772253 RepID=UPI001746CBB0|nr:hypothetical protein [Chryseoglobus sp. 28M-23]QOD93248.1 hypothetical protein IE160_09985 [Chryseoglobus sp. 28M-23]